MDYQETQNMAQQLIKQYCPDYGFRWHNKKRALGTCQYGPKKIALSLHFVEKATESEVKEVILHEIAHALTPGAGHGPTWKRTAQKLGATPKATTNTGHLHNDYKYTLYCPRCGIIGGYYRRPRFQKATHRKCGEYVMVKKVR